MKGSRNPRLKVRRQKITAYQLNHMDGFRVPYSLTIVDTPGFGDTRGISHDQKITAQIHSFFSARGGINCIDAVCFVVQASLARLTHTQKYIFDSILSIFGKDIAQKHPCAGHLCRREITSCSRGHQSLSGSLFYQ